MYRSPLAGAMLVLAVAGAAAAAPKQSKQVQRGEYLASIMDCGGCHTPGVALGKPDIDRYLAGADVGFQIPGLGIFYPPNLTPHPEAGLGRWSEAEIVAAVRTGVRPDGRMLVPVMPYHSYARLSDADAGALAAYLKSLKPIAGSAPANIGPSERPVAPYFAVRLPD